MSLDRSRGKKLSWAEPSEDAKDLSRVDGLCSALGIASACVYQTENSIFNTGRVLLLFLYWTKTVRECDRTKSARTRVCPLACLLQGGTGMLLTSKTQGLFIL